MCNDGEPYHTTVHPYKPEGAGHINHGHMIIESMRYTGMCCRTWWPFCDRHYKYVFFSRAKPYEWVAFYKRNLQTVLFLQLFDNIHTEADPEICRGGPNFLGDQRGPLTKIQNFKNSVCNP